MNSVRQSCSFLPNIPVNSGRPILKILASSKKISKHMNVHSFRGLSPLLSLYSAHLILQSFTEFLLCIRYFAKLRGYKN